MNKKAFTLIELLGVLVVLGILGVIALTSIDKNIKKGMYKTCIAQEKILIEGAKAWAIDNTPSSTVDVTVTSLENGGYIERNLKSPVTNAKYNGNTKVHITVSGQKYSYSVVYYVDGEKCENHNVG